VVIALDLRFHPNIDQLGFLQRNFASDYAQTIIAPAVSAATRERVAHLTMEEVYSTKRSYVEQTVLDDMQRNRTVLIRPGVAGIPFVTYDAVFLNEVELPQTVQQAIESKIAQQQATLEWTARVERERLESQRRQIEAQGTKAVLAIIGPDLTETFVRLRYVEMLERLAASPASKLIVTAPGAPAPRIVIGTENAGAKGGAAVEVPAPPAAGVR
jgi:regulator of protease activity HflC (stomatin/prohibitin superfamily)